MFFAEVLRKRDMSSSDGETENKEFEANTYVEVLSNFFHILE